MADRFEEETSATFRDEDIERARALVQLGDTPRKLEEHLTTATFDGIRNFATSYGDDNPLYCDEAYGVGTRWGSQIAPPLIGVAVGKALRGDPPNPPVKRPSFRGIHAFVSGTAWEFYRPVLPGDTVYATEGYESAELKQSEFAGRSMILVRRHIRFNQRAEVLSVARVTVIHTERGNARSKGKYSAIEPTVWTEDEIARIEDAYAGESIRGGEPRYWDDVAIGDRLGPLTKGPLTTTDIIVFHAGGYGFTPYKLCTGRIAAQNRKRIAPFYVKNEQGVPDVAQRVHWDSEWAQAIGTPMAYDYGVLRDCWLSHLLTDWMGDDAWLVRQRSDIRKFNYMGDLHTMTGEVVAKRHEDGLAVVDVELRGTNQRDEITCPASATIALPVRDSGGPPLPEAPADLAGSARRLLDRHRELGGR